MAHLTAVEVELHGLGVSEGQRQGGAEAVAAARTDEQRLSFEEEGLHVALERLRAKHEAALAHARQELHREVTEERDQVAAELADKYVGLASQLSYLLGRVAAVNGRVEAVNRAGGPWLNPVETVARGLPANGIRHQAPALGRRGPGPWPDDVAASGCCP